MFSQRVVCFQSLCDNTYGWKPATTTNVPLSSWGFRKVPMVLTYADFDPDLSGD